MDPLMAIEDLLLEPARCGFTHVIAIDGRAGAGKTVLAQNLSLYLSQNRSVEIVHCDQIYNGWELALGSNLTETLIATLKMVATGQRVDLPIFNWQKGEFDSVRSFEPPDVLIIEGVGSGQRAVRKVASITIWLDINPTIGLRRVLERDGYQIQAEMENWQVSEEQHFLVERTRENAHFIFSTD